MGVQVRIPTPLRRITKGQDKVEADGETVSDVISSLDSQYPGLRERLCDDQGKLRNFVNVYINGDDIRFLEGLASPTKAGDEISLVPAVAGG